MEDAGVTYIAGGAECLDGIEALWHELQAYHAALAGPWARSLCAIAWSARKNALLAKAGPDGVRVDIACDAAGGEIGYIVSSLTKGGAGEVESVFVREEYRRSGIGRRLIESALGWMDASGAKSKSVAVLCGNEQAFGFYEKFGFLPQVTVLRQKPLG